MPRRPRVSAPGLPLHLVQRGNDRQCCFRSDADCFRYLSMLRRAASLTGCVLHAYVLMSNHVHLLLTPQTAGAASRLMQHLGRRYVRYFNDAHVRSGTLWEGRFHASLVGDDAYVLACYRYIELNPVRAGMVDHPARYRWSSYACNALGMRAGEVVPHATYIALGPDASARQQRYVSFVESTMPEGQIGEIRRSLQRQRPLTKAKKGSESGVRVLLPSAKGL